MQFFNTVYFAVKHSRPLIHNYRIGVPNDVPKYFQRQSFKAFSTQSTDGLKNAPSDTSDKPKRPLTAYHRYIKLIKPKIVAEYPEASKTEISKRAKEMFDTLDEETLSGFEKQYSLEMEQYKTEMEAYKSKLANQQETVLSSIPAKPKKPPSNFLCYIKLIEPKIIQQHPNAKRTEIVKMASEMFKNLDQETSLILRNEFSNKLELYNKEVEAYNANLTDEQKKVLKELRSIEQKNKQRRQLKKELKEANKPKKPPNAYLLFVQKRKTEFGPIAKVTEFTAKISDEWNSLSEQEKSKYVDESKKLQKRYEAEISKWEASLKNTKYSHLVEKPQEKSESTKSEKTKKSKESTKSKSNLPKKTEDRNSDSVSIENDIYCKADSKQVETTRTISTVSSENEYNVQSCHLTSRNDETTISSLFSKNEYNIQSSHSSPKNDDTAISAASTTNKFNVQSCDSTSNDKFPEIDLELKPTANRSSINEIITKLRKNDFGKIVFLIDSSVSDKSTVNIVIGVTFVSVFIVLPFFYFFC